MELNFNQINDIMTSLNELKDKQLPFKLSLIIAKDIATLQKEVDFFIEQERNFAFKFLQTNEDGTFVTEAEGVFKIKEGMEEDCRKARAELDAFTVDVELRKIPMSAIENLEITPQQVAGLELLIDEEE